MIAVLGVGHAQAGLPIVAAENFYGDIAAQIGGDDVQVTSILANPDQDPHLFEASPSVARQISLARIVIYNGADYDAWMQKLLASARNANRDTIVVADLKHRKSGDNPHIWYDPETMLALASQLATRLSGADPAHADGYRTRLAAFQASMQPLEARIAGLRSKYADVPVTASEPVFGYMFAALGMVVRNQPFQLAVMNNTEPGASDIAGMENDLRNRKVRLFVYNSQASDPVATRMENLARDTGVPVLGVTETEPAGVRYQDWLLGQLAALDQALSH